MRSKFSCVRSSHAHSLEETLTVMCALPQILHAYKWYFRDLKFMFTQMRVFEQRR